MKYRIEKRTDGGRTRYWCNRLLIWTHFSQDASIYTESEREDFLRRELREEPTTFPSGGIWVQLIDESELQAAMKSTESLQPVEIEK